MFQVNSGDTGTATRPIKHLIITHCSVTGEGNKIK